VAKVFDSLARRAWLNQAAPDPDQSRQIADQYADEGYWSDAVDFYAKAKDADRLEAMAARAVGDGDLFILTKAARYLGRAPTETELAETAENAKRQGKERFAAQAAQRIGPSDQPEKTDE
jgi:uncharacterized protein (UPF0254 family)